MINFYFGFLIPLRAVGVAIAGMMLTFSSCGGAEFTSKAVPWQQVDAKFGVVLAVEREVYLPEDKVGRFVVALQCGNGKKPDDFEVKWSVRHGGKEIAGGVDSLREGMLVVDHTLEGLSRGSYEVEAEVLCRGAAVETVRRGFELGEREGGEPVRTGRIPLVAPAGVPPTGAGVPVSFGVPFPNAVLEDVSGLRVVDKNGREVPAQFSVRGRWGYSPAAGIRWLGVDMLAPQSAAWWPDRKETPFFLEYGKKRAQAAPKAPLRVETVPEGVRVNTGPLAFLVRSNGFNLLDEVTLNGAPVLQQGSGGGAYVVDQEGAIYRAANDHQPSVAVEEAGPLRAVIRVEGWYVKDGATTGRVNFQLPTDKLCKFITRIEAYAGLPWVRVLHQWVNTSDSYQVSFRDIGFAFKRGGNTKAVFGVEEGKPLEADVEKEGVYLIQHLADRFDLCRESGKVLATGKRSDGSVQVFSPETGGFALANRETWQRFPKELEVLPGEVRLHLWPAHGRDHPEIDPFSRERYHQLWFAHQGQLLNLRFPWETLFSVMRYSDNPTIGIYKPAGTAMGGVHSSAMGIAVTSDFMIHFSPGEALEPARADLAAFNARPTLMVHPDWLDRTEALGPVHPYDPVRFPTFERAAEDILCGMWDLQDRTGEFGMFLYRGWHHSRYMGNGYWEPYRLYSAGHHYESYLPWLYYARSGNPAYLEMGLATIRHLSDLGIIHYDDPAYEHQEFFSRQKRLVGSTRHTNGFVLWGGDHAILAHLTSYGGLITAHYMTGDARLREVVVTEWQKTLLEDRLNPEWAKAARLHSGRDNNNSLGEMLDLYQLTYDPRLLALIQPCVEVMEKNMVRWSRELPTVLAFRRTPQIQAQLIEAVEAHWKDYRTNLHNAIPWKKDPQRYALAAWLNPGKGYIKGAFFAGYEPTLLEMGGGFRQWEKPSPMACAIPDSLLHLPLIMAAAVQEEKQASPEKERLHWQMPYASGEENRIIVREDKDGEITLNFPGKINSTQARARAFDPNGKLVLDAPLPTGTGGRLVIPKDGVTGEYTILLRLSEMQDWIDLPMTSLPKEVYLGRQWHSAFYNVFYIGAPNAKDGTVEFGKGKTAFFFKDRQGNILATHEFSQNDPDQTLKVPFPEGGLWFHSSVGRFFYVPKEAPVVFSLSPESFFMPTALSLSLK